jgi:hypothetical protein
MPMPARRALPARTQYASARAAITMTGAALTSRAAKLHRGRRDRRCGRVAVVFHHSLHQPIHLTGTPPSLPPSSLSLSFAD